MLREPNMAAFRRDIREARMPSMTQRQMLDAMGEPVSEMAWFGLLYDSRN